MSGRDRIRSERGINWDFLSRVYYCPREPRLLILKFNLYTTQGSDCGHEDPQNSGRSIDFLNLDIHQIDSKNVQWHKSRPILIIHFVRISLLWLFVFPPYPLKPKNIGGENMTFLRPQNQKTEKKRVTRKNPWISKIPSSLINQASTFVCSTLKYAESEGFFFSTIFFSTFFPPLSSPSLFGRQNPKGP